MVNNKPSKKKVIISKIKEIKIVNNYLKDDGSKNRKMVFFKYITQFFLIFYHISSYLLLVYS